MKNIIYHLLVMFLFLFAGCGSNTSSEEGGPIRIDAFFEKEMTLRLSDFASSVEPIPLETNDNALIGTVTSIIFRGGKYYVGSASMQTDRVFVFDKTGKYLYKLDKRGGGPDEYTELQDLAVSDDGKLFCATDAGPKLLVYDLEQDTCLLSKKIGVFVSGLALYQNRIITYNRWQLKSYGKDFAIAEFDLAGHQLDAYYEPDELSKIKKQFFGSMKPFEPVGDQLYFKPSMCDTIYEIKDKELVPAYYFDFGKKKLPGEIFRGAADGLEVVKKIKKNQGVFSAFYYGITPGFIHFTIDDYDNNGYIGFYDTGSGRSLIAHHIVDDLYFKGCKYTPKSWQLPKNMDGGDIIWHVEPGFLKSTCAAYAQRATRDEWEAFCRDHADLVSLCNNLKDDDNPVLLRIKVKLKN